MAKLIDAYNPSMKNEIPKAYLPWYVVVTIFSILIGGALIAIAITMKALDDDLSWRICHIWTGVPLLVGGFMAIFPCVIKSRTSAALYLFLMFVCMVVCASGAIVNGFEYWMKYWRDTKIDMDRGACSLTDGLCKCSTVLAMPVSVSNCDNLKYVVRLMISTIALDVCGFIISTVAIFVSFMSACCGPWVYMPSYSKNNQDSGSNTNEAYDRN